MQVWRFHCLFCLTQASVLWFPAPVTPAPPPVEAEALSALISQHVAVTLITVYVVPVTPAALGPKLSALSLLWWTDGRCCWEAACAWKAPAWLPQAVCDHCQGGGCMGWGGGRITAGRNLNNGLPILPQRKQHSNYGLGCGDAVGGISSLWEGMDDI